MISNPLELEVQYANFRQAQMMADPVFIAVGAQRTSLTHFGDFCKYPIRILQQNNVLMQTYIYTSGGTKFVLLEIFTKHPSRSTADHVSKSFLCSSFKSPSFKSIRI